MKIIRTQLQSSLSDRGRGGGGRVQRRKPGLRHRKRPSLSPAASYCPRLRERGPALSPAFRCPHPTTQPLTEGTIRVPKETRVALLGVVTVSYHPAAGLWSEDCTLRWQGSRTLRRSKIVIPRGPMVRLLRRDTEDFHSRHSFCLLSVAVINART